MANELLHETENPSTKDKFFVCGGNPDNSGGGVIGSRNTWGGAVLLKTLAIKQGYSKVRILTWNEMMTVSDSELGY